MALSLPVFYQGATSPGDLPTVSPAGPISNAREVKEVKMSKIILTFKGDHDWQQSESEVEADWLVYDILQRLLWMLAEKK